MNEIESELSQSSDGNKEEEESFEGIELRADERDVAALAEKSSGDESGRSTPTSDEQSGGSGSGDVEAVAELLVELDLFQARQACNANLTEFLRPYVERCVDRKKDKKQFQSFAQFCYDDMVCTMCFHHDKRTTKKHLPPACRLLCCGIQRCERCLHVHEGQDCKCEHGADFLNVVRQKMEGSA